MIEGFTNIGVIDWQPVATAPRDGSWFFTKSNGGWCPYDIAKFDLDLIDFVKAGCGWSDVTHWRPAELSVDVQRAAILPGETIAEINTFLVHMAKRFRRRTSRRVLGIRINTMSRTQAMGCALVTYDTTLDLIGVPFGHPDHQWDQAAAHEFVDTELQHWEP